ncbi:DUF1289 domain-containing protein [Rhizobium bangladeshense]|uniref:DUF1289 domain-containing protein n=1 Tax=Rhizobium bangladeshense TaxID=1138189 RepID=A0ABS7LD19_9HYPH|nr:DUF1289 domain-containing protein [Rhizobium bangladeshense]MBX4870782.1 DUF1289 domain-containing protein [Rhizobium bangladeshense]MBX4876265.1 DUF1289 domain-containing protein [Rhizobium bangladeshense]MBX4887230.1 DUF1289 domain-containing protein [Rhizobium bangladeshense]MBX4888991.1 DUF1289 domain-containing protein [Rhizobium bangladeshense]MBX4900859.1 DUF1289 domain-containing protein [Rhizobium bangladeshense]
MQTPCIHVCSMVSATGFCAGCGRTLQEIGGWTNYTDAERRRIIAQLPARLSTAVARSRMTTNPAERPERPL